MPPPPVALLDVTLELDAETVTCGGAAPDPPAPLPTEETTEVTGVEPPTPTEATLVALVTLLAFDSYPAPSSSSVTGLVAQPIASKNAALPSTGQE
jgi:hypothetical protein